MAIYTPHFHLNPPALSLMSHPLKIVKTHNNINLHCKKKVRKLKKSHNMTIRIEGSKL